MKTKLLYLVVVLTLCGPLLLAGPAYDEWVRVTRYVKPANPEGYDDLIEQLQNGIENLKAERDALIESREGQTFISVAALRATGYELGRLEKPRKDSELVMYIISNQICQEQFKEWMTKAREWDEDKKE